MKASSRVGKAFLLAFLTLPMAACNEGLPFGGREATVAQSAVTDPQLRAFYQARQWKAAWRGESEKALREVIGGAMAHGLKPSLFLKDGALPEDRAERELALTKAALRYATALARGYADPQKVSHIYTLPPPRAPADLAAGLAQAVADGGLAQWFETLAPQTPEYRALVEAHGRYLQLAARAKPPTVSAGKAIKPGQRDARLPGIAAALAAIGYAPAAGGQPAAPPERYRGAIVDAVKRLQADLGLEADGVVGEQTLDALNLGPAGRARQLAIAMERLRWLEREPPPTRIDVNTAAAFLEYWRGGRVVDRRRVVVGEPGWETPQLASPMVQLVANPYWRVPDSIFEDELADKGPGYLAEQQMEFRDGRLVQLPGPKNALGAVKFDLKNRQSIYLHDTPAKALFATPERHRSHGCIRVHNALQFAAMLASESGVLDDFEEGLISGEETYVRLNREIPVRLLYHTAYWDGARVQFRPDVYGWDDVVAKALDLVRGPVRKPWLHKKGGDVGP